MLRHPRAPRRPKVELLAASTAPFGQPRGWPLVPLEFARKVIPKLGNEGTTDALQSRALIARRPTAQSFPRVSRMLASMKSPPH